MELVLPKRIFQTPPGSVTQRLANAGYDIPDFESIVRTKNGGIGSVFKGHPFPRKGYVYLEAIGANNKAKRITLALFNPLANIGKGFLNSFFDNYNRMIESVYYDCERRPFLRYEYYCEFSKTIWHASFIALRCLGVSFDVAYRTGHILATIFEFDDAYRYPLQDLFTESSKDKLSGNPSKEIKRLLEIYLSRCTNFNGEGTGAGDRIAKMAKLAALVLYLPPIKRAFRMALAEIDFSWLQFDDLDSYWASCKSDYRYFGKEFEDRTDDKLDLMVKKAQELYPNKKIIKVPKENGNIDIVAVDP